MSAAAPAHSRPSWPGGWDRQPCRPSIPQNPSLQQPKSATPGSAWDALRRSSCRLESALSVKVEHASFEEWWEPFTLGVGPAGGYAASLDAKRQAQLRELCREMLPTAPFILTARAWAARGVV